MNGLRALGLRECAIATALRGPDMRHSDTDHYTRALEWLKALTAGVVRYLATTHVAGVMRSPTAAQVRWDEHTDAERDAIREVARDNWHYMDHVYEALNELDREYWLWLTKALAIPSSTKE